MIYVQACLLVRVKITFLLSFWLFALQITLIPLKLHVLFSLLGRLGGSAGSVQCQSVYMTHLFCESIYRCDCGQRCSLAGRPCASHVQYFVGSQK